jgi:hypothetical protein
MHRFSNRTVLRRFRLAALLLMMSLLLVLAALWFLASGLHWQSQERVLAGLLLAIGGMLVWIIQIIVANRVRCPLCMMPPLAQKGCQKNHRARPLFGSYRLRVASSALLRDHFQCPYCGESTRMEARERHPISG